MITSMTIPKTGGDFTIDFTDVGISTFAGVGSPGTKLIEADNPNGDGGRIVNQFYEKRIITLGGYLNSDTVADYMALRRELGDALSFWGAEKTFKVTTSDGLLLQFNAIASGSLSLDPEAGVISSCNWEIPLLLSDPRIYSQTEHSGIGYKTVVGGGFALPTALPINMSGGQSNTLIVNNAGSAYVTPTLVRIYGPGTDFTLTNIDSALSLVYTGTLTSNEYVEFDFKNHTAKLNGISNVYGNVSGDWFQLAPGNNNIAFVVASGSDDTTYVLFNWRDGYLTI